MHLLTAYALVRIDHYSGLSTGIVAGLTDARCLE
jgi:hypothetical protein